MYCELSKEYSSLMLKILEPYSLEDRRMIVIKTSQIRGSKRFYFEDTGDHPF